MLGTLNHDDEEPRPSRELRMLAYSSTYLNPPPWVEWDAYDHTASAGLGHTYGGIAWTFPGDTTAGGSQ